LSGLNVHIYPNSYRSDSRSYKITHTLTTWHVFDRIVLLGTSENDLPLQEQLDNTREIVRLPRTWGKGKHTTFWKILKTIEWSWRVLFLMHDQNIACINCHSLSVLPLSVMLKFFHHATLIYEPHELETETTGLHGFRKSLFKVMEKTFIRQADAIIVVSESIANWYNKAYGIPMPTVVRNIPIRTKPVIDKIDLKQLLMITEHDLLFLYQGLFGKGRNIELLLRAFSQMPHDRHILFMGDGIYRDTVIQYSQKYRNIHYLPPVSPKKVLQYTVSADVGLCLIENISLSYYYSLPNKLFEYLIANLPVIAYSLPEINKVIKEFGGGWIVENCFEDVTGILSSLSRNQIEDCREQLKKTSSLLGWHCEVPLLLNIYRQLGFIL